MRMQPEGGFTLIELMITVAIAAILAMVALPAYNNAMIKNRRASAEAYLLDIAQRQQQYLLDNRSYAPDLTTLNLVTPSDVASFYTISIALIAGPPPGFTATATPKSGTAQASDVTLSINQAGQKTPADKW